MVLLNISIDTVRANAKLIKDMTHSPAKDVRLPVTTVRPNNQVAEVEQTKKVEKPSAVPSVPKL